MRNIITISGDPASGKGTCVRGLRERFEKQGYEVKVVSVGEIFRQLAEKQGMTIAQFAGSLENCKGKDQDLIMEESIKKLGERIEKSGKDNCIYIFDARMAWLCIPDSFKVSLKTDAKIGGERAFKDKKRGKEDSYETLEEAIRETEARKNGDRGKFLKKYGVDIFDENNFDLVIDASYSTPQDVLDCLYNCFEDFKDGKEFNKTWTSPRTLVPMQDIRQSFSSVEEVKKSIKETGYSQQRPIEIFDVNGISFIRDGHNRTFAAHQLGMTLVPYKVIAKDEEFIPGTNMTAREFVMSETGMSFGRFNCSLIYDHEDAFFRDENVYNDQGVVTCGNYGKIYGKEIYTGELLEEKTPKIPDNPGDEPDF